jgi:TPR repeat protein
MMVLAAALCRKGGDEDRAAAFGLWLNAAAEGAATAQCMAGYCYLNGIGCPADASAAARWLQFACEADEADALLLLGTLYSEGRGVARDHIAAARLFERAAEQGHAAAQYNLGICYGWEIGLKRDRNRALLWLRRAAAQGFAPARRAMAALSSGSGKRRAPMIARKPTKADHLILNKA